MSEVSSGTPVPAVGDIHEKRKADHIRINLEEDVAFKKLTTGLEDFFFMHQALPELDLAAVDTSIDVLGKTLKTPFLISSMTGGTAKKITAMIHTEYFDMDEDALPIGVRALASVTLESAATRTRGPNRRRTRRVRLLRSIEVPLQPEQ